MARKTTKTDDEIDRRVAERMAQVARNMANYIEKKTPSGMRRAAEESAEAEHLAQIHQREMDYWNIRLDEYKARTKR
jgi:hypothetical protein